MNRTLALTLALTTSLPALATEPPNPDWEVVHPEGAEVRAEPVMDSEDLGHLDLGERVAGEVMINEETDIEWLLTAWGSGEAYVPLPRLLRVHPSNSAEGDLPIGEEMVNRWWGMPIDYEASDLVRIPPQYTSNHDRVYELRAEACEALVEMFEAALADGVEIHVASAHRSGLRQQELYDRRIARRGLDLRTTARPGHSEHQLGTTVDLVDPPGEWSFSGEFDQSEQGQWLEENAARFGFVRSYYPHNVEETGYISEPWHWRYWGPETQESSAGE